MKGFTLIEVIVVIGIIGVLSIMGMVNIVEFQKAALLDSTVREFSSTLRLAKGKSVGSEIDKTITYTENGLPVYGVEISGNTYTLYQKFTPQGGIETKNAAFDIQKIDSQLSIAPGNTSIEFARLTGETTAVDFIISRTNGQGSQKISVASSGLITVTKI